MKRVHKVSPRSKQKVLGEPQVITPQEYHDGDLNSKAELIKQLIPLGLLHVSQLLQQEVDDLVGPRYARGRENPHLVRHGHNPGSVKLAGQRHPLTVPRVRDRESRQEVPLESYRALQESGGELNETLLKRVLLGLSCRHYEAAAESVPGAIGLSSSSVSREFIEASQKQLREFQERDLSRRDVVVLFLDGKTFAEDTMVVALGVTLEGDKVFLGFVQAGTENGEVLSSFLQDLLQRGLGVESGLLVVIDGGKGLRAAVKRVLKERALVQRCQWHKRENVVQYLPKKEQAIWRRRLQRAYEKPTYAEAQKALQALVKELEETNLSAASSLQEGMEETLTLHRLGLFALLGRSLKTTNCLESVNRQVEDRCRKVNYWKNSSQKQRWLAASLLDIEPRLRKIQGHKHLPKLREKLQQELGIGENRKAA